MTPTGMTSAAESDPTQGHAASEQDEIPRNVGRTLTHKTASGMAWMSLVQVVRQVLQLVSVSILARHIAPGAYGLVAMAALVTNFMETLRDVGTGYALVREREVNRDLSSTIFWLNCMFGGAATLLVIAVSWPAAYFFHERLIAPILQVLAAAFFLGALSVVPTALLKRAMQFRKVAAAQTVGAVCGTATAIVLAIDGKGVWSLVAGTVTTAVVTTILVWLFAPVRIGFVFRRDKIETLLHFGLNLTGFHVLNYVSRNADNLLVGKFLGSTPLGFYQMAYTLMTYPINNFAAVVTDVVYPALATLRDEQERFRAAYTRACRLIAFITFPLMVGLAMTAGPFVQVVLGPRWMPVAALLVVFGPLGALQSVYTTTGLIYNTTGRTDVQFRWSMVCGATYLFSFAIGLRWGILGVAGCYALAWTLLMVPSFWIPFRLVHLPFTDFCKALQPTIVCTLLMASICGTWRLALWRIGWRGPLVQLSTTVALGIITYAALLRWSRPPVLFEISTLLGSSNHPLLRFLARAAQRVSSK